jgi:NAD(P)-dependent dehydrogenase (short-subunit alcohol dehydrogenase family)
VAVFSGTGNTAGLGFAVAARCAALGMHICLSDRNDETDAMRSAVATLRAQVRERNSGVLVYSGVRRPGCASCVCVLLSYPIRSCGTRHLYQCTQTTLRSHSRARLYSPPQFPRLEIDCASCDVTRPDSCAELREFVHARYGGRRLGWVAANAGILLTRSTVLHGTESEWRSTYAVRERDRERKEGRRKGGHTVCAGVRACGR